jgi:RNA polymerase sigma factor (TIGR02999 family)
MESNPGELTALIQRWNAGDTGARDDLFLLVNRHLRKIANRKLISGAARRHFQPTEVVSEAVLRLAGQRNTDWVNREQFFKIIATCMDRVIVDAIRYDAAARRDRDNDVPVDQLRLEPSDEGLSERLLSLDRVFEHLAADSQLAHDVFIEKAFEGRTLQEIGLTHGISEDQAQRKWRYGRAFVIAQLSRE